VSDRRGTFLDAVTPSEQEVLDLLDTDDIVAVTRTLVRAPGENPPGDEGAKVAVLASACQERGLAVELTEVQASRPNLAATLAGGDEPGLLLLGHSDVVPAGDGWTVDPLGGEVRNGRIYGRGSADMLGGLAACLAAMSAVSRSGRALHGPVELAVTVDEEDHGLGIRRYLADGDRHGFAGCIVGEPTDLQTIIAARGDAYVEVVVTGKAAHSGNPSDGANAVYGAAEIIGEMQRWHGELAAASHPLVGPATWSVGQVRGGSGTSIVAAECVVMADRRLLPSESATEMLSGVQSRVADLGLGKRGLSVDVRLAMDMPGFETAADSGFVQAVDAALGSAGGPGMPLGGWTAACDGGFIAREAGVPVVVLGPGSVATQAHRPDESVAVDELLVAARAYTLAILRLLT
jgi:acetylornithine deacetylase/succinyl-diaminopimelate desuccinylase-like protein